MRLSTKGRYAVMAMVDLASFGGRKPVSLADIADRQEISLSYLEQLFGKLRKGGLVRSVRGPGGGYLLARTLADTRISDIVMAVDEPLKATRCKTGSSAGCHSDKSRCLTHDLWEELKSDLSLSEFRFPWRISSSGGSWEPAAGPIERKLGFEDRRAVAWRPGLEFEHDAEDLSVDRATPRIFGLQRLPSAGPGSGGRRRRRRWPLRQRLFRSRGRAERSRRAGGGEDVLRRLVDAPDAGVVFTSGATEANNLALGDARFGRVLVSAVEHPSVIRGSRRRGGCSGR